jgi:hypothetical protein
MTDAGNTWDSLAREFYTYVGRAITEWASVDDVLFGVFRGCIGPLTASAIIYYRTPGLDTRFQLTDELVTATIQPLPKKPGSHTNPDLVAWKAAIEGYQALLAVRRRIAHQPIQLGSLSATDQNELNAAIAKFSTTGEWSAPLPTFEIFARHERRRTKEQGKPPLKVDDLKQHVQDVAALTLRLRVFLHSTFLKYARQS